MTTEISFENALRYNVDIRLMGVEGSESQVYKGEENGRPVAFKIYRGFDLEQILRYQRVTNMLAEIHNGELIDITINSQRHGLSLYIVPIDKVITTYSNPLDPTEISPTAISNFIEGQTLFDMDKDYMHKRPQPLTLDPLVMLTNKFRHETGIDKMSVITWNVKPLLEQDIPTLAVTDVAAIIKDI